MPVFKRELPRVLNRSHSLSIVVGIIIGSGIFLVPREMMAAVGSSGTVYLVWIIGGLISLFGAMTYAEIVAGRPRYGGEYAFLKDAYGDRPAFLFMWTMTILGKPASLATIAVGLIRVLENFPGVHLLAYPVVATIEWSQLLAVAFTWVITALNIRGTRRSADVQLSLTWLKGLLIVAIAGFCFVGSRGQGSWHNFQTSFPAAHGGIAGFMTALVAALWAYNGWNNVSQLAGEIHQPERNLPVALIGGVAIVGGLYMLTNAAIQYVLPASVIAHDPRPAADAMRVVAGPLGATVISVGMIVSMVATFIGSALSGARIPFAAAHDGLFFPRIAYVHPRFGTPAAALVLQSALTTFLLLITRNFQVLFSLAIFSQWIAFGLAASTIFVFRRTANSPDRSFSTFWYPAAPICFMTAACGLTLFSILNNPFGSLAASAVIFCGIPAFKLFKR
jgi:APA family basic amino acid/polyamine antiporter